MRLSHNCVPFINNIQQKHQSLLIILGCHCFLIFLWETGDSNWISTLLLGDCASSSLLVEIALLLISSAFSLRGRRTLCYFGLPSSVLSSTEAISLLALIVDRLVFLRESLRARRFFNSYSFFALISLTEGSVSGISMKMSWIGGSTKDTLPAWVCLPCLCSYSWLPTRE